ncbi:hypothetical protein [Cochlodiniinecator piscidefendens]|uniref:hypothetical protein n=1 Tax=Cochlodiniinecator piscidefendens TaxID=2715756 RepID=UPI001408306F|nr:hypothetical protein [Cochlodiniinecator piscidefendens]
MKFYAHPDSKPQNRTLRGGRLTKWKGRAVSISPALGVISAALLMSSPVSATTCTEIGVSRYVCSGETGTADPRTTHTLGADRVTVTDVVIEGSFGANTSDTDASNIEIIDGMGNGLEITPEAGAVIHELSATSFGTGALVIDTTAATVNGIGAENHGTDLLITTGEVSNNVSVIGDYLRGVAEYVFGVNAANHGSGALVIDTTADDLRIPTSSLYDISRATRDSIVAENHGTDLTITTAGSQWITATQFGTGDVAIDTTGGYSNAIVVETVANPDDATGREVTITTADVGRISRMPYGL